MLDRPRVLVITGAFWPHITDQSLRLADWVQRLASSNCEVTVASMRPNNQWPERIHLGTIPVIRFLRSSGWASGSSRFYRKLADWVIRNATNFDYIFFDQANAEMLAVQARVGVSRLPVIVRCDVDCERIIPSPKQQASSQALPKAAVEMCRKASLIVAPNADSERQIYAAGIVQVPVMRVLDRGSLEIDRSIGARRHARKVLGDTNMDLFSRSTDRVILCPGELSENWGVNHLVSELAPLFESYRELRLWIHGDGPSKMATHEFVRDQGLHHVILLPGVFTDMSLLFRAADLCVFPSVGVGSNFFMPTCFRNSIPVLRPACKATQAMDSRSLAASIFSPSESGSLKNSVEKWIHDPSQVERDSLARQSTFIAEGQSSDNPRQVFDAVNARQSATN